jgi:ATP-dependent Clp protease ATP-binding subunit ClpA
MIKRLSADARRLVLASAGEEARRRGDRRVGTDHLLLGLLHEADGEPARALGVDLRAARAADQALDRAALIAVGVDAADLDLATDATPGRRPALTSGARAAFQRALEQARPARTGRIEPRHFLLALLDCQPPDPAGQLLHALGVDPVTARTRLAGGTGGGHGEGTRP